ncbi:MAG: hypothetical protein K1X89_12365 [Myxococcaceae bacterium]|nr:hypothetical protein [Myxococcaceae bacterium]
MSDAFDQGQDRPDAAPLDPQTGRRLPLHAFSLLAEGDAFEVAAGAPPKDGPARARQYASAKVRVEANGCPPALVEAVLAELTQQLQGAPQLVARLEAARPIAITLVPRGKSMAAYGFPKGASARASGLFWDHPSWPTARIGLLATALESERMLVTHEMAHAIARLAFTHDEQERIYRLMLPTYRSRAWVDEVFAIYSEREFVPEFTEREGHAPGVYGMARQRWDERHVFTRFVRALYHPHRPLAGSTRAPPRGLLG